MHLRLLLVWEKINTTGYLAGVDVFLRHFRYRIRGGERLLSLDMGVLASLTLWLPRAGADSVLSPGRRIFWRGFIKAVYLLCSYGPWRFFRRQRQQALPSSYIPEATCVSLRDRALLSPSSYPMLLARGIPCSIVSPRHC